MPCVNLMTLFLKPVANLPLNREMLETFPLDRLYQDAYYYLFYSALRKKGTTKEI